MIIQLQFARGREHQKIVVYRHENLSSSYAIKIRSKSQIDDTWLWKNGCSQREEGKGKKGEEGKRRERCRGGKKIELGRKKEREEEGANEREEEGPNTTRKKADMADVAGERNAAGTSGRKLGGRVRHGGGRGGRGGRGEDSVYGGREGRRWGSGERSEGGKGGGEGVRFRHLKPAVRARILFSLSS